MKRIINILVIVFATVVASAQTSVSYTYDDLNRLTEVNYSNGVKVKYTYDALGNRMTRTVTTSSNALRGDVTGNGEVDINDVTRLIDVILGKNVEYNAAAADCNIEGGNGNVDINDVTALINYVLRGSW